MPVLIYLIHFKKYRIKLEAKQNIQPLPNEKDKIQNRLLLNEEKNNNEETYFQLG
jgi:hypothetical protein